LDGKLVTYKAPIPNGPSWRAKMPFHRGGQRSAEDTSPADLVLGAFTRSAKEMNSILGFPGVLVLVAVLPLLLQAIPGFAFPPEQAVIVVSVALGSSVVTYWAQRYSDTKRAEAQSNVLEGYIQLFVKKYLESKDKIEAEDMEWVNNHILVPFLKPMAKPNQPGSS